MTKNGNLLIHCPAQPGFNRIFELGEYNMKLTAFGLLVLKAGESCKSDSGEFEVALVLLGGKCRISGETFDFPEVGERKNVFDGKPTPSTSPAGPDTPSPPSPMLKSRSTPRRRAVTPHPRP